MVACLGVIIHCVIIYCVNDVVTLLFLVLNVLDLLGQLGVPGGGGAIDFADFIVYRNIRSTKKIICKWKILLKSISQKFLCNGT